MFDDIEDRGCSADEPIGSIPDEGAISTMPNYSLSRTIEQSRRLIEESQRIITESYRLERRKK